MLLLTLENGSSTSSKSSGVVLDLICDSPDVQRPAEEFASSPIQAITSNEVRPPINEKGTSQSIV